MSRQRSFQAAIALLVGTLLYGLASLSFSAMLDYQSLDAAQLNLISQSISGIVYTFAIVSFIYSGWIVITFSRRRLRILCLEVLSVCLILFSTVPLFALAYGVVETAAGQSKDYSNTDYFLYSLNNWIGSNYPFVKLSKASAQLFSVQAVLGYFLLPLLVGLVLSVFDRLPNRSIKERTNSPADGKH